MSQHDHHEYNVGFSWLLTAISLCLDTALHFHTDSPYSTQGSCYVRVRDPASIFPTDSLYLKQAKRLICPRRPGDKIKVNESLPYDFRTLFQNEH